MSNRLLGILPAILISLSLHGQDQKKWVFGFYFSPDYSVKTPKLSRQQTHFMNPAINSEKGLWTYSTGVTIDRYFGKNVSIGTGLTYGIRGSHSVAFNGFYYGNRFYDDGTITDWNPNAVSYQTKYYFMELPLNLKYHLSISDKLSLYPTLGFSTNYCFGMKNSTYVHYSNYTRIINDHLIFKSNFLFSVLGGIGLDYKINDKIFLVLQPEYRHYLTFPTNENVIDFLGYKQTLHSFGTKFGIKLQIK